jgi:molybdopterin adenylyltransferase
MSTLHPHLGPHPLPHPDREDRSIRCAVLTLSDTRTTETDRSGQLIQHLLADAGHRVEVYQILKDEPSEVVRAIAALRRNPDLDMLLLNGGTGIAPRDTTYDAIVPLFEKTLPGFGELFRMLSYAEIGSRALASRAIAGTIGHLVVFSMPGSSNAVRLAMEKLILPEMAHLVKQLGEAIR